jgi:hypothetical protein
MSSPPKNTTVFLHTSKMWSPNYEETFLLITEALVTDKAKFVVVMSDGEMHCGLVTKEKILSVADGLFKIYKEDNE